MDVTEKKMTNLVTVRLYHFREGLFLHQRNPIQRWDTNIKGRMVHEKIKIFSFGGRKLLLKPLHPLLTVPTFVMSGLVGIQIDKAPDGQILNGLDKAVFVIWMVAKPLTKNVAVIVITH